MIPNRFQFESRCMQRMLMLTYCIQITVQFSASYEYYFHKLGTEVWRFLKYHFSTVSNLGSAAMQRDVTDIRQSQTKLFRNVDIFQSKAQNFRPTSLNASSYIVTLHCCPSENLWSAATYIVINKQFNYFSNLPFILINPRRRKCVFGSIW